MKRKYKSPPAWLQDGAPCFYQPIMRQDQPRFAGVISGKPWQLGHGEWVVRVVGLGPDYAAFTKRDATHVPSAVMDALSPRDGAAS